MRAGHGCVWRVKIRVVDQVERLGTRLEPKSFRKGEDPAQRRIEFERPRTVYRIAAFVAERAGSVWNEILGVLGPIDTNEAQSRFYASVPPVRTRPLLRSAASPTHPDSAD